MPTADQLDAVMVSFLGITESPPHSNNTPIGAEFGWNGVAWCCETCSVAMRRIGQPGFWTASVAQAIADARAGKNALTWLDRNAVIRKGDFVCFDWSGKGGAGPPSGFHIGEVHDPSIQTKFQTVAGNENDSVMEQWRDRTFVQCFIRPHYDGASTTEVDMTNDQDARLTALEGAWLAPGQSGVAGFAGTGQEALADIYNRTADLETITRDIQTTVNKIAESSGGAGGGPAFTVADIAKAVTDEMDKRLAS